MHIPVDDDEIVVGLVLHFDPDELEAAGATYTCGPQQRVQRGHSFLCIDIDDEFSHWVPLFSKYELGREAVEMDGATGHPAFYNGYWNYHPGQIWTATPDQVRAASTSDMSYPDNRNRLADEHVPQPF